MKISVVTKIQYIAFFFFNGKLTDQSQAITSKFISILQKCYQMLNTKTDSKHCYIHTEKVFLRMTKESLLWSKMKRINTLNGI